MTSQDILARMVAIRQNMLDRRLELAATTRGAVSQEDIELAELNLLEAQLRLVKDTPTETLPVEG